MSVKDCEVVAYYKLLNEKNNEEFEYINVISPFGIGFIGTKIKKPLN